MLLWIETSSEERFEGVPDEVMEAGDEAAFAMDSIDTRDLDNG